MGTTNELESIRCWLREKMGDNKIDFDETFPKAQLSLEPAHSGTPLVCIHMDWADGAQVKTLTGRGETVVEAARNLMGALYRYAKRQ